jgi:hypothetical protein
MSRETTVSMSALGTLATPGSESFGEAASERDDPFSSAVDQKRIKREVDKRSRSRND